MAKVLVVDDEREENGVQEGRLADTLAAGHVAMAVEADVRKRISAAVHENESSKISHS